MYVDSIQTFFAFIMYTVNKMVCLKPCFAGQSAITFIYDFVEEFKGPHPGFAVIDGRPSTG